MRLPTPHRIAAAELDEAREALTNGVLKPVAVLGWRRFYSIAELEAWALTKARQRRLSAPAATRASWSPVMNGDQP